MAVTKQNECRVLTKAGRVVKFDVLMFDFQILSELPNREIDVTQVNVSFLERLFAKWFVWSVRMNKI